MDLLSSLLHEAGVTHVRRIACSMLVYVLLMVACIWVPVLLLRTTLGAPLKVYSWSIVPELRVPLELALAHVMFLTLLDKHKEVFGKVQYLWFGFMCSRLGLSRFLLPYEVRKKKVIVCCFRR